MRVTHRPFHSTTHPLTASQLITVPRLLALCDLLVICSWSLATARPRAAKLLSVRPCGHADIALDIS